MSDNTNLAGADFTEMCDFASAPHPNPDAPKPEYPDLSKLEVFR